MVLLGKVEAPKKTQPTLTKLAPYTKPFISDRTAMIYVPGKEYPSDDERNAYELAGKIDITTYSMCLNRIGREHTVIGDIANYNLRQISPHPLLVLNGGFSQWSGNPYKFDTIKRVMTTLRKVMSHSDLALFLYVNQDARRFLHGQNDETDILIAQFLKQARKAFDELDALELCLNDDKHLFFHRL